MCVQYAKSSLDAAPTTKANTQVDGAPGAGVVAGGITVAGDSGTEKFSGCCTYPGIRFVNASRFMRMARISGVSSCALA